MSNVRDFGAAGDGKTDDTEAVLHAVNQGDGTLHFPPGDYAISRTIRIDMEKTGRLGIDGASGAAKILMRGPGPAFHLVGTHEKSADPKGFERRVWARQRMPTVLNLEIEGGHAEADGLLLEGVMQPTLEGVLLRELRHGVRLHRRGRNLLVSHSHIYHCRGVGIFLDRVNLHQAIIVGSHVSYCAAGGIKITGSEIRNLQITGNDIEYNHDAELGPSAEIWIDATAERATVGEVTISGNTIQSVYAPGGANIHIDGSRAAGIQASLITISGNLIGNHETCVRLKSCRAIVLSGNVLYGGYDRTLLIEKSQNVTLAGNCVDHRPHRIRAGVRLVDCQDVQITGGNLHDATDGKTPPAAGRYDGLLEIVRCRRVGVAGVQILDGHPFGLYVDDSRDVNVSGCSILTTGERAPPLAAVRWKGPGAGNLVTGCRIAHGTDAALKIDPTAGVTLGENVVDRA